MFPLSVMIKPASAMCNMSCRYCFYCDEARKRSCASYGYMSEETLENVIRRTLEEAGGYINYIYQGGEPTLRGLDFFRKAVELQKKYNRRQIAVYNSLQTNGLALDEEWCRFFKAHDFLIGLSVDGTKKIHDSLRRTKAGAETFEKVLCSAALLDAQGVEYNILTVVTSQVAQNIREIYGEYRERGWRYQQYIVCLDPLGEEGVQRAYSLTPHRYGVFLSELFDLWYEDVKKGRQPYIRQFENYAALSAGLAAEACDQRGVCGIQNVVEADGSVYPCDFYALDEYCIGNFNTDDLKTINRNRRRIGFLERSLRLSANCQRCRYYRLCRGGCQRNRKWNKELKAYENTLCSGYRLFFDACGGRIQALGEAIAAKRSAVWTRQD